MSGVTYWLQKQRKGELIELARDVGMTDYENLLKTDLEVALEEHLRANQSTLSANPTLEPYYRRIATSPVKREGGGASQLVVGGGGAGEGRKGARAGRRQTRGAAVEESDAPSDTPTTPSALTLASRLPLPPSPAVLADRIDASTTSLMTSLSSSISSSPLPSALTNLRSTLSSVLSVHLLILTLEAFGLRAQVLPLRCMTTMLPLPMLGLSAPTAIKIPDLFALLTGAFWGPTLLWCATSLVLPVLGGWVVNLRRADGGKEGEGWRVDPLVFSVAKGLLAWVVYARKGWGGESRLVVEEGVPGGSVGMLVGAGVGGLVSLWEGVGR